jgi:hypothetical protein
MRFARMALSVFVGMTLGATLSGHPSTKASSQMLGKVHVYISPVLLLNGHDNTADNPIGVRIAGISCVPHPEKDFPDQVTCYVATSDF